MRGPDTPGNGRRRASQSDMPAIRARDHARARPAPPAHPARPRRSSLADWSVSTRLVALFVMASVLGLVFGGLRIADAVGTASAYSRTVRLAGRGPGVAALGGDTG